MEKKIEEKLCYLPSLFIGLFYIFFLKLFFNSSLVAFYTRDKGDI